MQQKKLKINIAHLYPELLNIYGDWGNILTIKKRCEWRNIEVNIDSINVNDDIKIADYDFYFLGGGQDKQQVTVSKELQTHRTKLLKAKDDNAVFLGICGGYQLFGHYYRPYDGEKLEGLGLLDIYTEASGKRFIGNVTAECSMIEPNTLVGFENHSGLTYLGNDAQPLANIIVGKGNNGKDKTEGAKSANVFGSYLHGPLLPKNVRFADYLISLMLEKRYKEKIELAVLNDALENISHEKLIAKAY